MRRLLPIAILCSLLSGCGCGYQSQPAPPFAAFMLGGHLGDYTACPDEGYMADEAPSGDLEAPDDESCEPGQFTIRVENNTLSTWENVQVVSIALLNGSGEIVGTPPIHGVFYASDNTPFTGVIPAQSAVTLRIDFQGPQDPGDFYDAKSQSYLGIPCEITVDNGQEMLVIDPKTAHTTTGTAT